MIAYFSKKMGKTPFFDRFLGEKTVFRPHSCPASMEAVAVWGARGGKRALAFAHRHHLPLWKIEEGFYRSVGLAVNGAPPLSLIIDKTGIYYDASAPSDLENLLAGSGWEEPKLLERAQEAIQHILQWDLSKYNQAPAISHLPDNGGRQRILLIDQVYGDKSVELGMADASTFTTMLADARRHYPDAELIIKVHPVVLCGKKKGYLDALNQPGVTLFSQDCSPLSLLHQIDEVYTVTSQMGFEALLCGKKVHCYGMPFYAGWGVTEDQISCPRRTRTRTVEELFAAACILYPRYIHPVRGEQMDIMQALALLDLQRRHREQIGSAMACCGFSFWKRPYARAYVGTSSSRLRFFSTVERAQSWAKNCHGKVAVWSSKPQALAAKTDTVPLIRVEDGFLRSVGLGGNYVEPCSLVLDDRGIYYDPRTPSRLEDILEHYDFAVEPGLVKRAAALKEYLIRHNLSKYNLEYRHSLPSLPENKRLILVPGQVEDDASIRFGSPRINTNLDLLRAVRNARPHDVIIYKPHPDVEKLYRKGWVSPEQAAQYADFVLADVPITALLDRVNEVHTMTSLVGFEALMRQREVYTYGLPFYAGWGLTQDLLTLDRRTRLLTVDELVAAVLIVYPVYFDWPTRQICTPEDIAYRLTNPAAMQDRTMRRLVLKGWNAVRRGYLYYRNRCRISG